MLYPRPFPRRVNSPLNTTRDWSKQYSLNLRRVYTHIKPYYSYWSLTLQHTVELSLDELHQAGDEPSVSDCCVISCPGWCSRDWSSRSCPSHQWICSHSKCSSLWGWRTSWGWGRGQEWGCVRRADKGDAGSSCENGWIGGMS